MAKLINNYEIYVANFANNVYRQYDYRYFRLL